jgi:methionine-rich copper-binding protein CopC
MQTLGLPLALLLLALPGAARAHSELRATAPAEGATLARAPAEIVLRFNEAVHVTALRLHDAEGRALPLRRDATPAQAAREARALPPPDLPPGEFRVEWRAISADGHPIGGTLRFRVGAAR